MEKHYKLFKIKELADNDEEFIHTLAVAFLEEVPEDARVLQIAVDSRDYLAAYRTAHKMKPTVDLFQLGVLEDLIEVQDWGKFEQRDKDITVQLNKVMTAIDNTIAELKEDYSL